MDRKEALAKAWDDAEEKPDDKSGTSDDGGALESSPGSGDRTPEVADTKAKSATAPTTPETKETPDEVEQRNAAELNKQPRQESTPAVAPTVSDRAPNSWTPATKAHWDKLPPEVRAEVRRREIEIQRTLSETAQIRSFSQEFAQTIAPFSHIIRMQNSTPLQAVKNLMTTAAGLAQGTTEQKARIVAEIIGNYGVDVRTLDSVLSNSPVVANPASAGNTSLPPQFMQALQPVYSFMDTIQQQREQHQQQMQMQAQQEVEQMAAQPFFEELREEMADIMEVAAKRGRTMTLQQAYERAVDLDPEIKKIVSQQKTASRMQNPVSQAASTLARARRAASTVSGAPASEPGKDAPKNRRDMLSAAWDDATGN